MTESRKLDLHFEVSGQGPPLALLHGFLGSCATWAGVIKDLGRSHTCIAIDLPGHGRSPAPREPEDYRMKACVAGIRSVMERTGAVRPAILGYSMGGRIALSLALHYPAEVSALVLESASPGVENQDERDVRRRADDNLAAKLEAEGISSFLDVWEQQPIFASQARLPERTRAEVRAERMRTSVVGAANALRELSQGRTAPLWEQLPLLTSRTLTIAGEDDEGYCDTTLRIAQTAPNCEAAIVARAGHNTHLEQPDLFVRAVIEFLERDESPERTHTHGTA